MMELTMLTMELLSELLSCQLTLMEIWTTKEQAELLPDYTDNDSDNDGVIDID